MKLKHYLGALLMASSVVAISFPADANPGLRLGQRWGPQLVKGWAPSFGKAVSKANIGKTISKANIRVTNLATRAQVDLIKTDLRNPNSITNKIITTIASKVPRPIPTPDITSELPQLASPSSVAASPSSVAASPSYVVPSPSSVVASPSSVAASPSSVAASPSSVAASPSSVVASPSYLVPSPSYLVPSPSNVVPTQPTVYEEELKEHTISRSVIGARGIITGSIGAFGFYNSQNVKSEKPQIRFSELHTSGAGKSLPILFRKSIR